MIGSMKHGESGGRAVAIATVACLVLFSGCGRKHRAAIAPPAPQPGAQTAPQPSSQPSGVPATPSTAAPPPQPSTAAPPSGAPGKSAAGKPLAVSLGYSEEGIASWYGIPFHGRAAADGEIYDMETLVAAHRLMPFNTWVKVTNLANGKSVNVRIIDRGPFVEGRILDLSKAAARAIDLIGPGTGEVRIEVIAAPVDIPANDFYAVQIGAFAVYENAERLRARYAERFGTAQITEKQGSVPLWRVLVGKEPTVEAARQLATQLGAEDKSVFVVRLDQTIPGVGAKPGANATSPPQNPRD